MEKHFKSKNIRIAVKKDFDDVFRLLKQLWPDEELDKNALFTVFSRAIESRDDFCFCAEVGGRVVGFCALYVRNSFWQEGLLGYIGELIVDEPFREQGIGTALLNTAANKARETGCRKVELDSAFDRKEAHEFYEKVGFKRRAYLFSRDL
jgi:ribosomal protein S18 acetylase RimI-like enzyme